MKLKNKIDEYFIKKRKVSKPTVIEKKITKPIIQKKIITEKKETVKTKVDEYRVVVVTSDPDKSKLFRTASRIKEECSKRNSMGNNDLFWLQEKNRVWIQRI